MVFALAKERAKSERKKSRRDFLRATKGD